jgi:hypothetical protein
VDADGLVEELVGGDLVQAAEAVVHEHLMEQGVVRAAVDIRSTRRFGSKLTRLIQLSETAAAAPAMPARWAMRRLTDRGPHSR